MQKQDLTIERLLLRGFLNPAGIFSVNNNRCWNNGPYVKGSWISRNINGNANYEFNLTLGNGGYSKIDGKILGLILKPVRYKIQLKNLQY